jgi:hypothetical protein
MLMLDDADDLLSYYCHRPGKWFSASCPRLTFLSLTNVSVPIDKILSLVSRTPSLHHLKIIISSSDMIDGSRWEQLIKTKLLFLSRFEFYTRSPRPRSKKETEESVLNEIIAPFLKLFWTEEK